MGRIYDFAQPFVGHASRAFGVAALAFLVAIGAWRLSRWQGTRSARALKALVTIGVAWLAFGACEAAATREHADIRVDLLFTWPALCLLTLLCLAYAITRWNADESKTAAQSGGGS